MANLTRRRFLVGALGSVGLVPLAACGGAGTTPSQLAPTPAATTGGAAAASPAAPATGVSSTAAAAASAAGTPPVGGSSPTPAETTAASTAPTTATGTTPAAGGAAGPTPTQVASVANGQQVLLNGAGSTFDNPLFSKAFSEFTKVYPNVKVNYQSVGSGAGIQQLTAGTVDFGATDAPMSDQQVQAAGGDVLHLPITLGAVSVAYNLPGVAEGLKLDGPTLAGIYLGTIASWKDPAIAKLNPSAQLSDTPIAVVHRSDGSGTTDIFTTYLSQVSPDWKAKVGNGTAVNWPTGIGGKGSEGVAGQVKQTPGGIGYFELAYAKQNRLTSSAVDAGGGNFVLPSSDGASACAGSVAAKLPADLRQRIAGCAGASVYPISGFSWVVLQQNQKDATKGAALANLLWWMIYQGQAFAPALFYAPLPSQVVTLDAEKLRGVKAGEQPLLPAS